MASTRTRFTLLSLVLAAAVAGCGPSDSDVPPGGDGGVEPPKCKSGEDADGDGIPNQVEGCTADPDNDGRPSYFDTDSDNDGIPDSIEAGPNPGMPRDSDADGTPDYIDQDSDNDGVPDKFEDRDGNGVIGTCTTSCTQGSCGAGEYCSLRTGATAGVCVSYMCLSGETDPYSGDTDGDGTSDGSEGTAICNPRGEMGTTGLKNVQFRSNATGNWKVALEEGSSYFDITAPAGVAAVFDLGADEVAGFIVSTPVTSTSVAMEASALGAKLITGGGVASGQLLSSGSVGKSLDNYDTVRGATVEITTSGNSDVSTVRNNIMAKVLNTQVAMLGNLPGMFGSASNKFVVVYQVLYRDATTMIVMGAVGLRASYDDATKASAWHMEDLSNGTGLATASNTDVVECEQFIVTKIPKADIIWLVDESGSTDPDRALIVANATTLFTRAVAQGLDFRMGVTDLDDGSQGKLSRGSGVAQNYGLWILPTEATVFRNAVTDPSGSKAADGGLEHGFTQLTNVIEHHLPRSTTDATKIRTDAKLVIIMESDESAQELESGGTFPPPAGGTFARVTGIPNNSATLNANQQSAVAAIVTPFANYIKLQDSVFHAIVLPPSVQRCNASDIGTVGWGYIELAAATGGQSASICQADITTTLTRILDDISGAASPVVLKKFPISLSIAVAKDNVQLSRSRSMGFDYRFSSNSIVFFGVPFMPNVASEVVVSYRRYEQQRPID